MCLLVLSVTNPDGRMSGKGQVIFDSAAAVEAAMQKNRMDMGGRPVTVQKNCMDVGGRPVAATTGIEAGQASGHTNALCIGYGPGK